MIVDVNFDVAQRVTGITMIGNQILAMTLKHVYFLARNYQLFVWLILLNAWFIFIFMSAYVPVPEGEINFGSLGTVLTLLFFSLAYWSSIFIHLKIKERTSRSNLLQFICGVNRTIFWVTSFIIDLVIFTIMMAIVVGAIAAYQREYFTTGSELGTLILIFFGYGFSIVPAIYLISRLFKNHSTGEEIVPLIVIICEFRIIVLLFKKDNFLFLGALVYVVYAVLSFGNDVAQAFANVIFWPGLFLAPFSVVNCFQKYIINALLPNSKSFNLGNSFSSWIFHSKRSELWKQRYWNKSSFQCNVRYYFPIDLYSSGLWNHQQSSISILGKCKASVNTIL